MIVVGNTSFGENARMIKNMVSIEEYLGSIGLKVIKSRTNCPICGGKTHSKVAIKNNRVTCFSGCFTNADIIELHSVINNINNIESLNDLIKKYNLFRVMPDGSKPVSKDEVEFKKKAAEHLNICLAELDKISLLKYEILEQYQCVEYCYYLKDTINEKKDDLSYNKYSKEEVRLLYKKSMNFINTMKLLEEREV